MTQEVISGYQSISTSLYIMSKYQASILNLKRTINRKRSTFWSFEKYHHFILFSEFFLSVWGYECLFIVRFHEIRRFCFYSDLHVWGSRLNSFGFKFEGKFVLSPACRRAWAGDLGPSWILKVPIARANSNCPYLKFFFFIFCKK